MLLELHEVSKSFGGLKAVKDLSVSVKKGEIVGLIGPNGSGKSTLFNLISGLIKPDKGKLYFNDTDITGFKPHQICRLGIARTFQLTKPFMGLSVLDNVIIGRLNGNKPSETIPEAEKESKEILAFVGLEAKQSVKAILLTPFQRKRLEMARALATQPKLLLLDEMMAGLNPKEVDEVMSLVKQIRGSGVTVIVVEHIMQAVLGISDRIIVLNAGEKIAEGPPRRVLGDSQVIKAYLGDEKYAGF